MSESIITRLTLDGLRETLQLAGYRVETLTDPVANTGYLRSATAGLAFDVRPGNRLNDADQGFVDFAVVAVLQVQGELPLDIVNRWNATRRFGRLQLSVPFLVLTLDVSVAGGVARDHLRAQVEIWDFLVQQLIGYLREELAKTTAANGAAAAPAAIAASVSEQARASAAATVQ
jgi:putative sensory transduction regulator